MDPDGSWYLYVLFVLFVIGGGYFSASEMSYVSMNKIRMKNNAENGDRRAKRALYISNNFEKALTTIAIGNNIMQAGCAAIATLIATRLWGDDIVVYSTMVTTVIVLLISELIPKSIGKSKSEGFALAVSGSLKALMKLFTPVTFIFSAINKLALKLFKNPKQPTVTEDELYDIIETMDAEGGLQSNAGDLVQSALEFDDITVQDILTSRVDIDAVDIETETEELMKFIKEQHHSRIPVYEESLDNIVGILNIRQYLKLYIQNEGNIKIRPLLAKPHFIHRKTKIDELLNEMSRQKLHMSIVTDDYGGTMGIVTVEDILEELVGEIWDEDDEVIEDFIDLGGNRYEVSSEILVVDVFDKMGIALDREIEDEFERTTMGAWTLDILQTIPDEGASFRQEGIEVTVKHVDHNRITTLLVKPYEDTSEEEVVSE